MTKNTTVSPPDAPSPQKAILEKTQRKPLFLLKFLIALSLLLFLIFFIKNSLIKDKVFNEQLSQLNSDLTELKHAIHQESTALIVANKKNDELQNHIQNLEKQWQSTLKEQQFASNDWKLEKARYYLELAQTNTLWSNNKEVVLALLQASDQILARIHDPRSIPIRKVLAKNIMEINAISTLDTIGILHQLDAIEAGIMHLPLKNSHSVKIQPSSTENTWHHQFKKSLSLLEQLITIHHYEDNAIPIPTPVLQSIVRQKISLAISEAQWALLQQNRNIFVHALSQITRTMASNFMNSQPIIAQLTILKNVPFPQKLVFSEEALILLNEWIASHAPSNDAQTNQTPEHTS